MIRQRRLVFLIAVISTLLLVLSACGRGSDPEPTPTPEPAAAEEAAEEEAAEEEAAEEEAAEEEAAEEEAAEEEAAEEEAAEEEAAEEEAAEEEAAEEEATDEEATDEEATDEEVADEEVADEEAAEEEAADEEAADEEAADEEATDEEAVDEEAADEEAADEEAADEEAADEEVTEEEVTEEEAAEEEAADEEAADEEVTDEEAADEEAADEEVTDEEAADEEAADEEAGEGDGAVVVAEEVTVEGAESTVPSGPLTLVSARQVTEIVDERNIPMAAVSPDGATLVWMQSGDRRRDPPKTCIFTFADADKACRDVPEGFEMYPYQFYWSPDSTMVAFTENPLELGLESDIWVVNILDGTYTNLTDDGVTGSWVAAEHGTYVIDYLPMWSEVDGKVYFWRIEPLGDFNYNIGIYSVDAAGGEAELVRDLSDVFTAQLPWFSQESMSMDSVSALSPDGTQVATIMAAYSDMYSTSQSNLWLVDLVSDEEPQWLMSSEDFQAGYAAWQNLPGVPQGLSWMGDSSAVVVDTFSNDTHAPLHVYYYVDVESGEATPTVDFSDVESMDALFEPAPGSEIPMRFYSPWTASLSPADDSLLMFNDLGGTAGMMQAIQPPTGELPVVLAAAPSPLSGGDTRSSRADDGKVVMYGVLFTFEEE